MAKLTKEGINSFKFFLAYSGSLAVSDDQLIYGFRRSKELGALPIVSCQLSPFSLLCSTHPRFNGTVLAYDMHLPQCDWFEAYL